MPQRIQVRFDENPELGGYTLARWQDGVLGPLLLPAVGETLELPRLHGVLAL
ncbi:MAG: hypothetical protein Q8N23_15020 [Archangium sp.]|nr:hypothetical protein [Archangium sp.]MDP3153983.1 hypothetical protein [Archangium sp.]MDP3574258.1 hypothetical protein [Archangium sp.]